MAILTNEDRAFFRQNGYIIISNAVSKEDCDRVIDAIWEFMGKSPTDVEGWYTPPEGMTQFWSRQQGGMVEMYNHQSMWDTRQNPKVYQIFTEILGTQKLWVNVDRVNMTPPKLDDHPELDNSFIHWDVDTSNLPSPIPHPSGLQGVLYLADTAENQGGFQCVPTIYGNLEQWLKTQPADRDPFTPNLEGHEIKAIPGKAGDLLIWDKLLPHGNGHNYTDKPRFAQYITMYPADPAKIASRQNVIESWRTNRTWRDYPYGGDPREWESKKNSHPAVLTPLGRKLLGVDPWE